MSSSIESLKCFLMEVLNLTLLRLYLTAQMAHLTALTLGWGRKDLAAGTLSLDALAWLHLAFVIIGMVCKYLLLAQIAFKVTHRTFKWAKLLASELKQRLMDGITAAVANAFSFSEISAASLALTSISHPASLAVRASIKGKPSSVRPSDKQPAPSAHLASLGAPSMQRKLLPAPIHSAGNTPAAAPKASALIILWRASKNSAAGTAQPVPKESIKPAKSVNAVEAVPTPAPIKAIIKPAAFIIPQPASAHLASLGAPGMQRKLLPAPIHSAGNTPAAAPKASALIILWRASKNSAAGTAQPVPNYKESIKPAKSVNAVEAVPTPAPIKAIIKPAAFIIPQPASQTSAAAKGVQPALLQRTIRPARLVVVSAAKAVAPLAPIKPAVLTTPHQTSKKSPAAKPALPLLCQEPVKRAGVLPLSAAEASTMAPSKATTKPAALTIPPQSSKKSAADTAQPVLCKESIKPAKLMTVSAAKATSTSAPVKTSIKPTALSIPQETSKRSTTADMAQPVLRRRPIKPANTVTISAAEAVFRPARVKASIKPAAITIPHQASEKSAAAKPALPLLCQESVTRAGVLTLSTAEADTTPTTGKASSKSGRTNWILRMLTLPVTVFSAVICSLTVAALVTACAAFSLVPLTVNTIIQSLVESLHTVLTAKIASFTATAAWAITLPVSAACTALGGIFRPCRTFLVLPFTLAAFSTKLCIKTATAALDLQLATIQAVCAVFAAVMRLPLTVGQRSADIALGMIFAPWKKAVSLLWSAYCKVFGGLLSLIWGARSKEESAAEARKRSVKRKKA